jgi:hypothetical protein
MSIYINVYIGAGFSEVIVGRKRWFLFPPPATAGHTPVPYPSSNNKDKNDKDLMNTDINDDNDNDKYKTYNNYDNTNKDTANNENNKKFNTPKFDPNMTVLQWVTDIYPSYINTDIRYPLSDYKESPLTGPKLSVNTDIRYPDFKNTDFENMDFENTDSENTDFEKTDIRYTDLNRDNRHIYDNYQNNINDNDSDIGDNNDDNDDSNDNNNDYGKSHNHGLQECILYPGIYKYKHIHI